MKNAVIYARYSSAGQNELSIDEQIRVCTDYATRNGFSIIASYIDKAKTGTNDKRPNFQQMIADSAKGLFSAVIVYMVDRFARNRYDSVVYKHQLKENGVRVHSALESISDSEEGELYESILEWSAEKFSEKLSKRVKGGQTQARKNGTFCGGHIPYGYKIENKKVIVHEERADIIRYIFQEYAKGISKKKILENLTAKGIKNALGKPFALSNLRSIMSNKKYTGRYEFEGVEYDVYPQIVSEKTFDDVKKKLDAVKHAPAAGKAAVDFLLQGKAFCGHCRATMHGDSGTSKTGVPYYYYSCHNHKLKKESCPKKAEKKDYLEQEVVNIAVNYVASPKNIDPLVDRIYAERSKHYSDDNLNRLNERIKKVESDVNKAVDAMIEANSSTARKALDAKIADYEIMLNDLNNELSKVKLNIKRRETKEDIKRNILLFISGDPNDENYCKRVIDNFVHSVYVYDDKLVIFYRTSTNGENASEEVKFALDHPDIWEEMPEEMKQGVRISSSMLCQAARG